MTEPEREPAEAWPVSGAEWPANAPLADRGQHPFAIPEAARYQVGGHLGRGGMGVVHAALDARLGRTVALKRAATPDAAARLAREAVLTAGLDHPGIVQVHDAGMDADGTPFYTMRVAGQRTLADALAQAPDLPARKRLLRQLLAACEAVAYAHDKQVVHRDLKPANILLGRFGETQVADWGLACSTAAAESVAPAGTPGYVPPEHGRAARPDPRADVYALGVTLAEVIAGRPLGGDLARDRGSVRRVLAGMDDVAADLTAIVLRATEVQPNLRYQDAKAMAADLEALLDGRRVVAHRYTAAQLAKRLAVAWRAQLLVAAVAVVVLVVAQGVAFVRALGERDRAIAAEATAKAALLRADASLGQALREAARSAAQAGQLPEAEQLATQALALQDEPVGRGILMRARAQTVERLGRSLPLPTGCLRTVVDGNATTLLCLRADTVAVYDVGERGAHLRWQVRAVAQDGTVRARK
ncbi:MAG: serine/threonine protein kinase [Deltaproteobacteria bacterium]|nr:serine/threonine protein kinase [Deltaproteobacteria bacterium]